MPRRGENIRKRKDGRWEGRFIAEREADGKAKYRSVYGKSYAEVKEKLREAIVTGKPKTAAPLMTTFREAAELWVTSLQVHCKGSTILRYRQLLDKHIFPTFAEKAISSISVSDINIFLKQKLEAGKLDGTGALSAAYVRSIAFVVRSVHSYAVKEELCAPFTNTISKPVSDGHEPLVMNPENQRILEESIREHTGPTELGILISLYAGLRIGEICALSWQDIDLESRILHVRRTVTRTGSEQADAKTKLILSTPKTKSSVRDIPIHSSLFSILYEKKKESVSPFAVSDCQTFLSPRTFQYRYHRILKKLAIPSIHFHALRHTFATRCIEAGVDAKSLCEMLGHATVQITLQLYVHSSMDTKRTQLEKLLTSVR